MAPKKSAENNPKKIALPKAAPVPKVEARAWVLTDLRSGERLAGKDDDRRLPIASTTKIMVALVALEDGVDLDEEVTVSQKAASFAVPIYSNVGLYAGDTLSVRELLQATLISSGDDAVYALAEHLGDGSAKRFIDRMNAEARDLGLKNTHFENPSGLDARGHYSSAGDLARMTRQAFKYPEFREMVATPSATITTQDREIPLTSTNELLSSYAPATGVKTGTTPGAGSSLVASARSGDEAYVAVFLNAKDRFGSAIQTLEYGFTAHERSRIVAAGDSYTTVDVPFRREKEIELVAKDDVTALVDADAKVKRKVEVRNELPDEAKSGTELGTVVATVDGKRVGESPLVARKGYEAASAWDRVWYTVEGIFREKK